MTMGPEIFAWICEDGLILVSRKLVGWRRSRSGGTQPGSDFDFDLHLWLQEAGDDQQGGGRPDLAEHLAADREQGVRIFCVGDVIGRADNVVHSKAAFPQRGL